MPSAILPIPCTIIPYVWTGRLANRSLFATAFGNSGVTTIRYHNRRIIVALTQVAAIGRTDHAHFEILAQAKAGRRLGVNQPPGIRHERRVGATAGQPNAAI